MQIHSLDWEDPLEKEMATHCSILAWKIPQTEEPGRLQSMGVAKNQIQLADWARSFCTEFCPTPDSYIEGPNSHVMVFGDESFER